MQDFQKNDSTDLAAQVAAYNNPIDRSLLAADVASADSAESLVTLLVESLMMDSLTSGCWRKV